MEFWKIVIHDSARDRKFDSVNSQLERHKGLLWDKGSLKETAIVGASSNRDYFWLGVFMFFCGKSKNQIYIALLSETRASIEIRMNEKTWLLFQMHTNIFLKQQYLIIPWRIQRISVNKISGNKKRKLSILMNFLTLSVQSYPVSRINVLPRGALKLVLVFF